MVDNEGVGSVRSARRPSARAWAIADAMTESSCIEIHELSAHIVNDEGRVRGIRIIGVADRRDRAVFVTVSPGKADGQAPLDQPQFRAGKSARWVTPESVGWHGKVAFRHGVHAGLPDLRIAHFWCLELDLKKHPGVPPIQLGLQPVPLWVEASYLHVDRRAVTTRVDALYLGKTFPVGVLFVHGIGTQTKSETLIHWTAPLLQWINEWFDAASTCLGQRAPTEDVEGWLAALVVHEGWSSVDRDHSDRRLLATKFSDHVFAKTQVSDVDGGKENFKRSTALYNERAVTEAERAAGERFATCLQEKLKAGALNGMAELADARLIDGDAPIKEPSSVEVRVSALTPTGDVERSSWLMAESHWAESFRPPAFTPFGVWCLRVAPIILVYYFARTFARRGGSWQRCIGSLLLLATLVLIWVIALLAMFPAVLIPWERLRATLLSVQRSLAGVVGDSYVFLEDFVQRRAIVDRVRRDVEWMSQRCRGVVVVAHSQGAAVANLAINRPSEYLADDVQAFVTLGAGVRVLERLERSFEDSAVIAAGSTGMVGAALFWSGITALMLSGEPLWSGVVLAGVIALLYFGRLATKAFPGLPAGPFGAASTKPWVDFFATDDPVPCGPLGTIHSHLYQSNEVHNRGSFLTDHTSYWQNAEEVVGRVARIIAQAAAFPWLENAVPDVPGLQHCLVQSRRERVRWLFGARMTAIACTAMIGIIHRAALHGLVIWAWTSVGSKLTSGPAAASPFPGRAAVWHALSPVVPLVIYVMALENIWSAWGRRETKKIMRAQACAWAEGWVWTFWVGMATSVFISLTLADFEWTFPALAIWSVATVAVGVAVWVVHRR